MITCQFEDGGRGNLRHGVIDAIVLREGQILLVKRASDTVEGGKWALPGGFIKRDENAREATLRELQEETGYVGMECSLFCIITYPDRTPNEDRQNIVFCYVVEVDKKSGVHDSEVTDVGWFEESEIDTLNVAFDHKKIIKKFIKTKEDHSQLPLIIEKESDY